jgi:hypothetical protein
VRVGDEEEGRWGGGGIVTGVGRGVSMFLAKQSHARATRSTPVNYSLDGWYLIL